MGEFLVAREWKEFREAGMLWWANRALQVFGWVIVASYDDETKEFLGMFPARTKYRGFTDEIDERGFTRVSEWMRCNAEELLDDCEA